MPKNKHESFAVTFKALSYLQKESATPTEQHEAVFVQSHIFVGVIFAAIADMSNQGGDGKSAGYKITETIHHLALIGATFADEMQTQFQNLLELAEGKSDEK